MKKILNEGFSLVELIIVMVLIGILAVVAVPRMSNTINSGEEASENGVLAALESAVEMYAMDQVVENSSRSYPYNPFDHMEKAPQGYTGENSVLDEDGEWTFENGQWIAHQRNDNRRYKWSYNSNTGQFGDRVAY
jgi:prepilin-type N-terminal cleavage/methylation domain-containing protein